MLYCCVVGDCHILNEYTAMTMTDRFCIGDHYYLCDNKILCQFDYEERLVLARLSSNYNTLSQMKKLQATAASATSLAPEAATASSTGSGSSLGTGHWEIIISVSLTFLPGQSLLIMWRCHKNYLHSQQRLTEQEVVERTRTVHSQMWKGLKF